jgi:hypothetical protein
MAALFPTGLRALSCRKTAALAAFVMPGAKVNDALVPSLLRCSEVTLLWQPRANFT